jgi:hypothetical protein
MVTYLGTPMLARGYGAVEGDIKGTYQFLGGDRVDGLRKESKMSAGVFTHKL